MPDNVVLASLSPRILLHVVFLVFLLSASETSSAQERAKPAGHQPGTAVSAADSIKVMSFNLRYGSAADGANRWELRRDLLSETIKAYQPDLLGTQETLAEQKQFLDEQLADYQSIGVGRDDGQLRGEMTAIWFRRDRFELIDSGHFWLSERPAEPGSVSWDSSLTRMASWALLQDRKQPQSRPIYFLNTHFDHRGTEARAQSAILIRQMLEKRIPTCDLVLTGDFNCSEDSAPYRSLFGQSGGVEESQSKILWDSFRVASPNRTSEEGTFNGFKTGETKGPRIDWIGISQAWKVTRAGIDRTSRDGKLPSDHFPVFAEISR